jgi:DnaJ like chaperone protein
MKYKGKLLGALFGLIFAGPIGMALGFIAGHLYDLGYFRAFIEATQSSAYTYAQQVFFNNTFKIMGYIAKSDGRVSENEISAARQIISKMGLNENQKQVAIHLFSLGKQNDFNLDAALSELQHICRMQPALLQLFLEIQYEMANADGPATHEKQQTLHYIANKLGLAGFRHHQQNNAYQQHHYRQHTTASNKLPLQDAYEALGVSSTASQDEIKKAYRRLMSQNHPDKLIAKGLPPDMIKVATQKTQRIKEAYERIKAFKGF